MDPGMMFAPGVRMTNSELGEGQRQQVNTLLAELQTKYNSNTTTFGEEAEVIATPKTFRQIQDIYSQMHASHELKVFWWTQALC